eukprot:128222-Chlamydomonas_euryale.AAC.1
MTPDMAPSSDKKRVASSGFGVSVGAVESYTTCSAVPYVGTTAESATSVELAVAPPRSESTEFLVQSPPSTEHSRRSGHMTSPTASGPATHGS